MAAKIAKPKGSWGGRREGAGAKPLTLEERHRRQLRAADLQPLEIEDPALYVAERIGVSERVAARRPDLAERFEVCSPGEHIDRFGRFFCRHTRSVPAGPPLGSPFGLEPFQKAFLDEALEVDDDGRRVYSFTGLVIPRKNGKTTLSSLLALYMASPADGEHRPEVILAAGTLKQAGKLWENATAFITDRMYGSVELRALFLAQSNSIQCPLVSGKIERVAGDGDSNHSLDPHVVIPDELHTWKTPKQRENWKALTTAQGAREDPIVVFLSTEGEGDDNELAALLTRMTESETTGREKRTDNLTVYRDRDAGDLVHVYGVRSEATIADVDEFVAANPAPWRTSAVITKDLRSKRIDEPTKLRLYGNRRGHHRDQWISDEKWAECQLDGAFPGDADFIPARSLLAVGADGARRRDTTAVSWAWLDDTGRCRIQTRVWSLRPEVPHHVLVPGGRLDNDLARDFIRDVLLENHDARLLFYDERYFGDQAADLSNDGMSVVEMHQGKPEMQAAWDGWYEAIHEGNVPALAHDGCPVLAGHVKAAIGIKTERGWKVSKRPTGGTVSSLHMEKPIDALAASVMARFAAVEYLPKLSVGPMIAFA